ncbi:hypothetical protein [Arthrobacter sp. StoSoilB20]|uniref:hypothetical protein n=1 Tax=Arthrobacter sp. StoSoilB20 TaxID=2830995 RepID=UPI001CC57292|nr:hypothetical protein [Arthrobacter sp. StoSoilB20]BCW59757.1 hypothetical protein StoSoilB20_31040 [Arthrobacter sp. StoSoilB20]
MSTNESGKGDDTQPTAPLPRETTPTESLPKETRPSQALPKPRLQEIPLTPPLERSFQVEPAEDDEPRQARIGTVVWGLIVIALAALIVISTLGWVTLNGTYVLIGLMIGAGAALVVGGLLSARKGSKKVTTTK